MTKALATLLQGAIDYAGVFPPAKLDMPSAVRNYLAYRPGSEGWLLNRFACPAEQLAQLANLLPVGASLPVTVIGSTGPWDEAREQDAELLNDFVDLAQEKAEIKSYEVRLPQDESIDQCLKDLGGFDSVEVFLELPWGPGLHDQLAQLAETEFVYAKARTGGNEASDVPGSEQLALFLYSCVNLDWPFKLTAGLHHPFPAIDRKSNAHQHGLVSVLGAVALLVAEDLSTREVQKVLDAESHQWRFEHNGLECLHHKANLEDIEASREFLLSIGSCSVQEPLEELDALGLVGGERR